MKQRNRDQVFEGLNNLNLEQSRARLLRGGTYKDLSTVCITPARSPIDISVVMSWTSLMKAMNQKFVHLPVKNMEVGDAYNAGVQTILDNPELSKWKYMLTLETDNTPPCDGLLKLYESIEKFDVVGGLYWTKGENGQPMIYGDPNVMPVNFIPQLPQPDTIQRCNGLGMGFTLFKIAIFKKIPKPWFRTVQEVVPGQGARAGTQDLMFFQEAAKHGYQFACDTRVRVGHFDESTGITW